MAVGDQGDIDLARFCKVMDEAGIICRFQEIRQDKHIWSYLFEGWRPGLVAIHRGDDGHFPIAFNELGRQVKVHFIRAAHLQPG